MARGWRQSGSARTPSEARAALAGAAPRATLRHGRSCMWSGPGSPGSPRRSDSRSRGARSRSTRRPTAGGRCRSFFDRTLGRVIDNGNHLLSSGNRSALAYMDTIGARNPDRGRGRELSVSRSRNRPALDGAAESRRLPFWLACASRRVAGHPARDYLSLLAARPGPSRRSRTAFRSRIALWRRSGSRLPRGAQHPAGDCLGAPALGGAPGELRAGRCRLPAADRGREPGGEPLEPALRVLERHGAAVALGQRLRPMMAGGRPRGRLDFGRAASIWVPATG